MNPVRVILLVLCAASLVLGAFGLVRESTPASRAVTANELQNTPPAAEAPSGAAKRSRKCATADVDNKNSPPIETDLPRSSDSTGTDTLQPRQHRPFDAGNASISGRVVSDKGETLAGVTVTALSTGYVQGSSYWAPEDPDSFWQQQMDEYLRRRVNQRRTSTDSQGRFVLMGLHPDHTYNLTAQLSAHVRTQQFNVTPGDSVVLTLIKTPGLRGRVVTQEGKPVESFTINTRWTAEGGASQSSSYQFSSSKDGRFEVPALPGNLSVLAQTRDKIMRDSVIVQVGESGAEVELVMEPAAMAVVTVTDTNNNPCVSISVTMNLIGEDNRGAVQNWAWGVGRTVHASTNNAGIARTGPLLPGRWRIMAGYNLSEADSKATEVDLLPGDNVIKLQAEVSGLVIMQLTDEQAKPVAVLEMGIYTLKGNDIYCEQLPDIEPGIKRISELVPGRYRAVITCRNIIFEREFEVTEGVTRLSFTVPSPATLTVRVDPSAAATRPLEEGESPDDLLRELSVRAFREPRPSEDEWDRYRTAEEPSEDKSFTIGGLEPGEWIVEITDWSTSEQLIATQRVTIKPGDNEIRVVLASTASLKVTVNNTIPHEREHWVTLKLSSLSDTRTIHYQAFPGNPFNLKLLPAGEYQLYFTQKNLVAIAHLKLHNGENFYTVSLQPSNCLLVESVVADSQAAKIGIQPGDLIIECNGVSVSDIQTFTRARDAGGPEKAMRLRVLRNGNEMSFELEAAHLGVTAVPALR